MCCQRGCTVMAACNGCYRRWHAGTRTECRSPASRFPKYLDRTRENFHLHSLEPGDHSNKTQTKTSAHTAHAPTSTIERSHARAKQRKAPPVSQCMRGLSFATSQRARTSARLSPPGTGSAPASHSSKPEQGISCGSGRTRSAPGTVVGQSPTPFTRALAFLAFLFSRKGFSSHAAGTRVGDQLQWRGRRWCCCVQCCCASVWRAQALSSLLQMRPQRPQPLHQWRQRLLPRRRPRTASTRQSILPRRPREGLCRHRNHRSRG